MNERARQKVILALDFPTLDSAFQLAQTLSNFVGLLKINIHLFTAEGPSAVAKLNSLGPGIFLDLKFHDIPNTVKGAVASAVALPGVQLLDLHALGGLEMMRAAAKARDEAKAAAGSAVPKLLAITILTSMDNTALRGVGIAGPASKRVVQLARLAQKAGMDGVVASPQEIRSIRRACGKNFLIVVPGIRPATAGGPAGRKSKKDDQARVATPQEAIRAGADYLVIGRPITGASDPAAAARAILEEISSGLQ